MYSLRSLPTGLRRLARALESGRRILRTEGIGGLVDRAGIGTSSDRRYQGWIARFDDLSRADQQAIRSHIGGFSYQPKISVLLTVFDPPLAWLRESIESVLGQLYGNWQLSVADDASTNPQVVELLRRFADQDPRIVLVERKANGGISAASNSALESATGDFIALLDHDDQLAPHALYLVVEELNRSRDADLLFSDEDKFDESGRRHTPYFKTDWNPDLLLAQNCVSHLGVYRTELVQALGGFRLGYEGSQDWDLALRVSEVTSAERIRHIPFVLYHWRSHAKSTSVDSAAKPYATDAGRRAVQSYLDRTPSKGRVMPAEIPFYNRVHYPLPEQIPLVSIIIPTRDQTELLQQCIRSLQTVTDYSAVELIVVDNDSRESRALEYLESLKQSGVTVLSDPQQFNYSAICNRAAQHAKGDLLVFLNNDTTVIQKDWLRELVVHAIRPEIGAVGAKLLYPSWRIQHAGIRLGGRKTAVPILNGRRNQTRRHFGRAQLIQNYSAVTGACLAMRAEVFQQVGGFDESLAVSYNDVDLCLRLRTMGYRILWNAQVQLMHAESATLGNPNSKSRADTLQKEKAYLLARWADLNDDPYYNPNLSTAHSLEYQPSFSPRIHKPWL